MEISAISGRFWRGSRALAFESLPNSLKKLIRDDALNYAAALAFFFLLSMFPLLIFLASLLAYLPEPNLFPQIVHLMSLVVPASAMGRIRAILAETLRTNAGLLSFGIAAAVWIASEGFDALIGVLDRIYEVRVSRPYWRQRLLALGLTFLTGLMVAAAMLASLLGPWIGSLLPKVLGVHSVYVVLWPLIQWASVVVFLVLSLQLTYLVAPRHRQRFFSQTPGAILAIVLWIAFSFLLNWYLAHFGNYNRVYGTLGAVIALLLWFYCTALAILLGAELNAELLREKRLSAAAEQEHAATSWPMPE